jgi:membrane-bound lytic murein transglycosylase D
MMRRALPSLEYVLAEVERGGLPTEFALLPLVESGYQPGPSRKGGVAGIWQLMPATAREHGLRIDREYDGRLDLVASTATALSLLERLHDQFPQDWRFVDMAYNAGHYRIAMAMAVRERRGLEARPEQLEVSPTTHVHVAKLQALACLVRDAEAHALELPSVEPERSLVAVPASGGLDFELASRLARIDIGRLYELNPGYLRRRVPRSGTYALVLPQPDAQRLVDALARIPAAVQSTFGYARVPGATEWQTLASRTQVPRELLAALNGAAPDQRIPAGTRLYLPAAAAPPEQPR